MPGRCGRPAGQCGAPSFPIPHCAVEWGHASPLPDGSRHAALAHIKALLLQDGPQVDAALLHRRGVGGVACPPTKTVPAARKAAPKPKRAAGTTPSGWRLQKRSACTGAPAVGAVAWPEPNQARHVVPPRLQQRVAAPALHTQLRARQGALQAGPLLSAGDKQVLVCNLLGAGGGGRGGARAQGLAEAGATGMWGCVCSLRLSLTPAQAQPACRTRGSATGGA